jgi:uncharacterized membrane protein
MKESTMPFCTQCGKQITDDARFCSGCGARQSVPGASGSRFLDSIEPRTASILCYIPVVGWLACVVVLAARRFQNERTVRFHAFQGLYLFVAWLLVDRAIGPMIRAMPFDSLGVIGLMKAAIVVAWVFMLIKASHNEAYRLPVFGELAERSIAEQRF